jgi:aldehyde:ferredoxin oxidoreductase
MTEIKFNLLEIDLTTKKSQVVDVTEDVAKFIGGRGLGAKLLWDKVPDGTDPLSPDNVLYFGIGPLTGFHGSVTCISAKSPLTLLSGYSCMNGHFAKELVYAGYNAGVLLTGKSDSPVYIYINNDEVEIRDAAHLWGKLNLEAQQLLRKETRKELKDQNVAIATIGPAGEHLVRNADICHDLYHHAARLGMGAVMGSKNVKAMVVQGRKQPQYVNPGKLAELLITFFQQNRRYKAQTRRWGHSVTPVTRYYAGTEGVKNKMLGWHETCDLSNPVLHEQRYKLWNDSCNLCDVGCKVPYMRREPPLGPCVGEIRHDNAGGWNANVLIPGFGTQLYLTPFVDNLGMDNEDVSGVVAWMMECYERGIVTKEDLGGINLTWGNLEAICKLVRKIAYREGIGDILAEGLKFAPKKIGKGSEAYAMTNKGVAITSYEPRGSISDAINLVMVPVGELHGMGKGKADPFRVMADSLTVCSFLRPEFQSVFGFAKWGAEMLNAACGWELAEEDFNTIAHRLAIMERCFCLKEGHIPTRDDILPARFFNEVVNTKYGKPLKLDRAEFVREREKYYVSIGLNKEGVPPKEYLKKLGLEFVAPVLEKRGLSLA